ncbi:tRNA (guanosine(37)-N1)-methyltransferase TrmD [Spiroplasma endosymbiont of Crioceris asparagi]|uniref:tRNA (guanosine(37)-N1)-methyltransferase TrmD n=1 Tax=Spiroplasma endosymbiont of Crioceris asparagi TaxID=3066286 RepID=UPI0030D065B0
MKISILTLFPNIIDSYTSNSIFKKAIEAKKIEVEIIDIRKFTNLKHNQVDEYQIGGGDGMLMMIDPVVKAIESVKTKDSLVVLTSPQGKTWNNKIAFEWSQKYNHIIIICGHYEGIDARIKHYIDLEISIGDYVITGGELASLIISDTLIRFVDGVIRKGSVINDSFEDDLLDYDAFTKPIEYNGYKVPDVLLSGHHKNIEDFRRKSRLENTFNKRVDLLEKANLSKEDLEFIQELKQKGK